MVGCRSALRAARPSLDENNQPAVSFSLNTEGGRKFGVLTSEHIGRQLAIVVDGRVRSVARIDNRGSNPVHGTFTALPEGATVFVGGMRLGDGPSDSTEVLLVGVTIDRIPPRPNPFRVTDLNANGRAPPDEPDPAPPPPPKPVRLR